jgi:formamidopyrimidine-DNA glycosylase
VPELPEVEVFVRDLRRLLTGRTIARAQLLRPGLAEASTKQSFARSFRGARIDEVGRRGKHILFRLDSGRTLITHLRMTGKFLVVDSRAPHPDHTHAIFWLDGGDKLLFTDQRHFAMMMIVPSTALSDAEPLRRLAPEPFEGDFTEEYLYQVLARSKRQIKTLLLDQTRVTGLGNIYAAEVLHRARINPKIVARRISRKRASELRREILAVLAQAIENGNLVQADEREPATRYSTIYSARLSDGSWAEGGWRVYDREGQPCPNCATPVKRFVQGGRSTYYCPRCQRR